MLCCFIFILCALVCVVLKFLVKVLWSLYNCCLFPFEDHCWPYNFVIRVCVYSSAWSWVVDCYITIFFHINVVDLISVWRFSLCRCWCLCFASIFISIPMWKWLKNAFVSLRLLETGLELVKTRNTNMTSYFFSSVKYIEIRKFIG